jgi:hypothetical protein
MHARKAAKKLGLAIVGVVFLLATSSPDAAAEHDHFAYKFPCSPSVNCFVTTLLHSDNAFDFDINGSASNGTIITMAEGIVTDNPIISTMCTWPAGSGLGRMVLVEDVLGSQNTCGHLASFAQGLAPGTGLFQGASVGIEGNTGYAAECEVHLHWEVEGVPDYIDGREVSSICTCLYLSTNEIIGDQTIDPIAGFEIDAEYYEWGQWTNIGYVSDAGRGLTMHRHGNGWEQNFNNHDGQSGIYVPDSSGDDAFWVQPEFWPLYEQSGGATGPLRYPVSEHVTPCPTGAPFDCQEYQQFECGFIYYDGSAVVTVITCGFDGLYAITTSGQYKRLVEGGGSWVTKTGSPPGGSQNLKSFGAGLMIHKEGTGGGQTFRVSQDGGESWSQTASPGGSHVPVDADYCGGTLWLAWLDFSVNPRILRVYASGDFGSSIGMPVVETATTTVHANGGVACDHLGSGNVAVVVQNGTVNAKLAVNTSGGWTVMTKGLGTSNAYRVAWGSDGRLLVTNNVTYTHLIRSSDDGGATFTTRLSFGENSVVSADTIDVIATEIPGVLFAFLYQGSAYADGIWRSIDNGTTWQLVGAYPAGFSPGQSDPKGIAYDAEHDAFYVAWRSLGKVSYLPDARTRSFTGITSGDWITVPQIGTTTGIRTFTIVRD